MFYLLVSAIAALLTMLPVHAAIPTPYFFAAELVERIECVDPKTGARAVGTGTRIDANVVLTAEHVVRAPRVCTVDGLPAQVVHREGYNDLATLIVQTFTDTRVPVACELPKEGTRYWSFGHALAGPLIGQHYDASYSRIYDGKIVLRGTALPGQSGSGVLDDRGYLIGIVNSIPRDGRPLLFARSVTDTYLCGKGSPNTKDKH